MHRLVLLVLISLGTKAVSQVHPQMGARSNGLGNASICFTDVWSVYNNPGAFGFLEETSVGVAAENRFLLKELSSQSLAFGLPAGKTGNFGLHFQQYGFNLYRELNSGFVYALKLAPTFSMGVSMNYHGIFLAENYGSKHTFSAGIGMFYSATKNLKLGMRIQNLNRTRLAEFDDERLPTNFGLGFLYQVSKKVSWSAEAEKDLIHPINIKTGIEIQAHEILAVRLGMNTWPFVSSFGFGLKLKSFHVDAAAQWHTVLGLSPSFGLHYSFN